MIVHNKYFRETIMKQTIRRILSDFSYFKELYFSIFMLLFFLSIAISTIFFFQFSYILKAKLYREYQTELGNSMQYYEDLTEEIHQIYVSMTSDYNVIDFFNLSQPDSAVHYFAYKYARKITLVNPSVYSIAAFNLTAKESFITTDDNLNLDYIIKVLNSARTASVIYNTSPGSPLIHYLSFAYPCYNSNSTGVDYGVSINVDCAALMNSLFPTRDLFYMIADSKGNIISSQEGNDTSFGPGNDTSDILHRILTGPPSPSSFVIKTKTGSYVVNYTKASESGMTFISIVSYHKILNELYRNCIILFLTMFAILISGYVLIYLILKKINGPLNKLTLEMSRSKFNKATSSNEFAILTNVFQNAMSEIDSLASLHSIDQTALIQKLLHDILNGTVDSSSSHIIKELNFEFNGCFICCIKIHPYGDRTKAFDSNHVYANTALAVDEYLSTGFHCFCIMNQPDLLTLFINTRKDYESNFEELIDGLSKIQSKLSAAYQLITTFSLHGIAEDINDCHRIYQIAKDSLNNRFVLGNNQLVYQRRLMEQVPNPLIIPDKLIKEIAEEMKMGNQENFASSVEAFLEIIRRYTWQSAFLTYQHLVIECSILIQQLDSSKNTINLASTQIESIGTLDEARDSLMHIYQYYQEQKNSLYTSQTQKFQSIIQDSKEYVNEHFMDPSLCVELLADRYNYSPNYFGKMFYSVNHCYVNDYIKQVRIQNAEKILMSTNHPSAMIADMVGFTSTSYFYSVFKKETGLTPAQFRATGQ